MYKPSIIRDYVQKILIKNGVPERKARITSDVLIEADMRGIFSHGVNNLDLLVINSIKQGGTDPDAVPEETTLNINFPIRHIDARGDLGPAAAMDAMELARGLARKSGFGKVYVYNANHFGIAAVYSEAICAEKDLAGRVSCTTPSVVKPYGGKKNRLGTNLISWSIPYDKGIVTIDMATTIHAVSGILKSLVEGGGLPFPVYDEKGRKTTSSDRFDGPFDFLQNGSMIPLGGLGEGKADAGYKGTGLAFLIELDGVIGGGESGYVNPILHGKERWIRQTFEAWRIDTLFPRDEALQKITQTIADLRTQQGKNMFLPGEKEIRRREKSLREGISYFAGQIERLEKLGGESGLASLSHLKS